jgi:membrane protease YdiL (CAAX protease family)
MTTVVKTMSVVPVSIPVVTDTGATTTDRRVLRSELLLVLAVSLGASAVYALLSLIRSSLRGPLNQQSSTVIGSRADNAWLDLAYQLVDVAVGVVPVLLVAHFLLRNRESVADLGLDRDRVGWDLGRGLALAAVVGGTGLGLYLAARGLGLNTTVAVTTLDATWWRDPVLVLAAAQNALLEEVVVLGYVLHRLRQLGWSWERSAVASSLLRGSYHLYQGIGGFVGNAVMGLLFCWLYRRWGRLAPFVVAHTVIDVVAFVGYAHLVGRVGWLD